MNEDTKDLTTTEDELAIKKVTIREISPDALDEVRGGLGDDDFNGWGTGRTCDS
jgi:hypothetical protein